MTDLCAMCGHAERDHVSDGEGRFKCTGVVTGIYTVETSQCICRSWVEP